jgi:hypothetical protein
MIKGVAALAVTLGLGLACAGCSSGPTVTEMVACAPILKLTVPSGGATEGTNESIATPTKLAANLIHSGDPTLSAYGRTMTNSENGDFLNALRGAQTECRKIGVG